MEQLNGWQALHDFYAENYSDKALMGYVEPARIQVRYLAPDLAYSLIWVKFTLPGSKSRAQVMTSVFQKFEEGWKIISSQACSTEMK
jgi:hypothetical protein